jgi:hypothetical protein
VNEFSPPESGGETREARRGGSLTNTLKDGFRNHPDCAFKGGFAAFFLVAAPASGPLDQQAFLDGAFKRIRNSLSI